MSDIRSPYMVADVSEPADAELILQLQAGSLEGLGGLYDRHRNLVYRTALAITGDTEVAADLLHDTFLRLYRFGDRIDPSRPIEPWLYRMTTNMAYSWIKRRGRWLQALREMAEKLARESTTTPAQQAERNEAWSEVRRALRRISPEKRVVVVLYYLNDLSINEIAEILELPNGTVKSRLHYGRQALREHLGLEGKLVPKVGYEAT